jgi:single-strand DNA-binding protein
MMNESYITVTGRLVADPERRTTRTGVPFAAFRVASTTRRLNRETGQYEDGSTSFFNVTAFRSLGANVAHSLKKGQAVVVYGRLRVNQWMRSDNSHGTSVEVDAYNVGHDLTWGTTELRRVARAQLDQHDRMADDGVQAAMAELEGEPPVVDEDPSDFDPGDLASRARQSAEGGGQGDELDADTDPYEVQDEPTGLVPRGGGEPALSSV